MKQVYKHVKDINDNTLMQVYNNAMQAMPTDKDRAITIGVKLFYTYYWSNERPLVVFKGTRYEALTYEQFKDAILYCIDNRLARVAQYNIIIEYKREH